MDLLVNLLAMLGDNVLALLNVGGVNNGLALLSWDLSLMLLGNLVALVFNMVLAVRPRRVTLVTSFSISLVISMRVTSMNLVRIMTNNLGAVVDLGVLFLTVSGDNLFTVFNVGGVNNDVIFLMTLLTVLLFWSLVALFLYIVVALWSRGMGISSMVTLISWICLSLWSSIWFWQGNSQTSKDKNCTNLIHFLEYLFPPSLL